MMITSDVSTGRPDVIAIAAVAVTTQHTTAHKYILKHLNKLVLWKLTIN